MVDITFYGAVGKIGGNKVLVKEGETRILLDFGRDMGLAGQYYEEFIQVRSRSALLDLLKLGVLPQIDGIYPRHLLDINALNRSGIDLSEKLPLSEAEDYWIRRTPDPFDPDGARIDGAFISHAHFDHIQDVSFLHKDIPIHSTETTRILAKAITHVSQSGVEYQFHEVDDYDKVSLEKKKDTYATIFPGELELKKQTESVMVDDPKSGYQFNTVTNVFERNYDTSPEGDVGALKYKLIPVGHSVPGACSILLTSSTGARILYTGDFRFHGRDEPSLSEYMDQVGPEPVDVLICEGTRIGSDKKLTEDNVYEDILKQVKATKGLVLVDFNWKDSTRFETMARVAEKTKRTFVINPKLAFLLYELHTMDPGKYPDPTKIANIKVYLKRQEQLLYSKAQYKQRFKAGYLHHWGKYSKEEDENKNILRISEKLGIGGNVRKRAETPEELTSEEEMAWRLAIHHIENGVKAYQIRKDPGDYILMFSFWDANELFDLSGLDAKVPDSRYIRASCEPFNDEMEIDEGKLMNWLDKFGVHYEADSDNRKHFRRAHVSGHAARPELKEFIEKVRPKKLIPVHTMDPEAFKALVEEIDEDIEVIVPELDRTYSF